MAFLACHRRAVELDQIRQQLDAVLAVERVLADRIVPEPEHFEIGQRDEVLELAKVTDQVFAKIELLEFFSVLENFERGDVVE